MPTYDFKCDCGKTSTITISIPPGEFRMTCICGKAMTRIYQAPAVTFKGKGWGKDD